MEQMIEVFVRRVRSGRSLFCTNVTVNLTTGEIVIASWREGARGGLEMESAGFTANEWAVIQQRIAVALARTAA